MSPFETLLERLSAYYRLKSTMPDDLGTLVTMSDKETGINIQIVVIDTEADDLIARTA